MIRVLLYLLLLLHLLIPCFGDNNIQTVNINHKNANIIYTEKKSKSKIEIKDSLEGHKNHKYKTDQIEEKEETEEVTKSEQIITNLIDKTGNSFKQVIGVMIIFWLFLILIAYIFLSRIGSHK